MGILVIAAWVIWIGFALVHIRRPTLIPLRVRVASFYIPATITVLYSFTIGLGLLAVIALVFSICDDYSRREEMD